MMSVLLLFVLVCLPVSIVQGQLFVDEAPPDYLQRATLDDCVDRFHTNKSYLYPAIYNGEPVRRGEFSAFASIGWTRNSSHVDYHCGGSLITLDYVITAAHCAVDGHGQQRPDTIRLGVVEFSQNDAHVQKIPIKRFVKHPSYKPSRNYHDIALIELERSAEPSAFVCTACLWTRLDLNFDDLIVMGFGATSLEGKLSPVLLRASLAPLEMNQCFEEFPKHRKLPEGVLESQFCAGALTKDCCQGDSGGPILVELVDVRTQRLVPFVAGVISFGSGCNEGSLGVYSRIASYVDWIEATTGASFDHRECARRPHCVRHYTKTECNVQVQQVYPEFHVRLLKDAKGDESVCGGTLVDYRHVITSADCVSGASKPTTVDVSGNRVAVSEITVHPDYSPYTGSNNLAILKLEKYLNSRLREIHTSPVCLWRKSSLPSSVFVSALEDGFIEKRFIINTTIVETGECRNGLICSENKQSIIPGICKYDHGGPVSNYADLISGTFIPFLYGVNSKGSECGGNDNVFEATSVSQHYDWIESVVLGRLDETHNKKQCQNNFMDSSCRFR